MQTHVVSYPLTTYLINAQGNLGLYHLLNLLQDAASSHAHVTGIGSQEMEALRMFWVLTRQHLVMRRWPKWHDVVRIETWIRAGEGAATNRDFRIFLGDELIGEATTNWLSLSTENRRPVIWDRSGLLGKLQREDRVPVDTGKIPIQKEALPLVRFKVRNSDIDQNMHVNNTKYAQWMLDAVPFEDHFRHELLSYEVNFLAETKLDDLIRIERTDLNEGRVHFQGMREADHKAVFTAQVSLRQRTLKEPADEL